MHAAVFYQLHISIAIGTLANCNFAARTSIIANWIYRTLHWLIRQERIKEIRANLKGKKGHDNKERKGIFIVKGHKAKRKRAHIFLALSLLLFLGASRPIKGGWPSVNSSPVIIVIIFIVMYYCYWVVLVHDREHIVQILGEKSRDDRKWLFLYL